MADINNDDSPVNEAAAKLEKLNVSDTKSDEQSEHNENGIETTPSEERKIFVGGISAETTGEDLLSFFSQFGAVNQAQVKYDRMTGRSRGFAFVEFAQGEACQKALKQREQTIKGKQVEIKPAKSRENKKVFVGGLPSDFPEDKLRENFEKYGKVEDIEWPFDRQRNVKRNFAFIVFDTEEGADKASEEPKQMFGERECDVKKATPQSRRQNFNMMAGGPYGGGYFNTGYAQRGGLGYGMRGGPRGGMMGYGGFAGGAWNGAPSAGAWSDWYGGQAAGQAYGGAYGGYTNQYYGAHAPASGSHATGASAPGGGADYWASSNASNNTWGGTFNSYDAAGAGSGNRQGARPYQNYQH